MPTPTSRTNSLQLRLPPELKSRLEGEATLSALSLNQYCLLALQRDLNRRVREREQSRELKKGTSR